MLGVAADILRCLIQLRLYIAQRQVLKVAAEPELLSRRLHRAGVTMAGDLHVDPV